MKNSRKLAKRQSSKSSKESKKFEFPEDLEHPENLSPILEDPSLSEEEKVRMIRTLISISRKESFSGPLPPPKILAQYNDILTDGAERIMQMAEKQSNHRITLERQIINEEIIQSSRGQWLGFILGLICLILASLLAYLGHDTVAGIFGTTTIIGLVSVFVLGKKGQHNENNRDE